MYLLGGSPLTPRIAVWLRDPGFRLGVFFILPTYFKKTPCPVAAVSERTRVGID